MKTKLWKTILGILILILGTIGCQKGKKGFPLWLVLAGKGERPSYLPDANSGDNQGSEIPSNPSTPEEFPNPSFVIATGGNQQITLQWTNQPDATSVEICYNTTGILSFPCDDPSETLHTTTSNSFVLNSLNDNETWYFLLRHTYPNGNSSGVTVNATTLDFPNPTNFQALGLTISSSPEVHLSWTNTTGPNTPSGFAIYRSLDNINFSTLITQGPNSITSFVDTSVSFNTTYYYRIKHLYSSYSRESSGVTISITPTLTNINPPSGLVKVAGNQSVNLSWNSLPSGQTAKVYICNSTNPCTKDASDANLVCSTSTTSCNITGLTNGTTYYFAVYAEDSIGNLSNPNQTSATPFFPAALSVSSAGWILSNQIGLSGHNSLITRIEVYFSTISLTDSRRPGDGGNGTELRPTPITWWSPSTTNISHNNLTANTTYYYSIYAVYFNGSGDTYSVASQTQSSPLSGGSVVISQTSNVLPENTQTPYTYNWDQTIQFSAIGPGLPPSYTIRCEITNSLSTTPPNPTNSSPLCNTMNLTNGAERNIKAAVVDSYGNVGQITNKKYKIQYNAYQNNLVFQVVSIATNTVATDEVGQPTHAGYSEDVLVKVSYTPGSGETFTILKGTDTAIDGSGKIAHNDSDLPTIASLNSSSFTPTDYSISETRFGPSASASGNINLSLNTPTSQLLGKPYSGGHSKRFKTSVNVVNGGNYDLAKNLYAVYPKLSLVAMDVWNRPKITPYLFTKQEPVIQVDVNRTSYFTGATSPANGAQVYFRIQYAEQHNPYGTTNTSITWSNNYSLPGMLTCGPSHPGWADPDFTECAAFRATTGQPLEIINTEPYTTLSKFTGNGGTTFKKLIPAVNGRAYYQIDNPYDTCKIGEACHYSYIGTATINSKTFHNGINTTTEVGELYSKAFRTLVRFRVRARGDKYRDANQTFRSFESSTVAAFNESLSAKVYDVSNTSFTSDMPVGFRGFPLEVAERYEGYGTKNHIFGFKWYQKHGITWLGTGEAGHKNEVADSIHKHFDPNRTKIVIYSHGWQKNGFYELFVYRAGAFKTDNTGGVNHFTAATDLSSWQSQYGSDVSAREWMQNHWITRGYNVGFYHWNKFAQEDTMHPNRAQMKIWTPQGSHRKMAFYSEVVGDNPAVNDKMGDPIRSASVAMILAQEFLDSLPDGYTPTEIVFAGHSLGNQVVMNATQKLLKAYENGLIPASHVPSRVDLLDPYWSDDNSYYTGETTRAYADYLHTNGIPVQWYKTSALTQLPGGDSNSGLYRKTNYVKLTLSTCDNGYVPGGAMFACRNNGEQHGEAVGWFFRSIQRTQDETGSWCTVAVNSTCSASSRTVSAATPPSALYSRLNPIRDSTSNWRWFDVGDDGNWNKTINTLDDQFIVRSNCCGTGSGNPGM